MMAVMALLTSSCGGSGTKTSETDSLTVSVSPLELQKAGEEQTMIGVAVDGAMNSVEILAPNGERHSFSYPDLEAPKRVDWNIGDTLTVKYLVIGENDSVLAVMRGSHP